MGSQETVVYKKSFGAALTENLKDLKITFDGLLVELSLLELLVIELRARRAEAMLNNALNDEFDRVVDACSKEISAQVKKNHGIVNKGDATKAAARHAKVLGMQIRKVPDEVIRKIGLNQRIARKYKRDKAVKITRGVAATGLSAAGVAVPGTTAFAIVGLVRSIAALAKEITTVMMSVERKMKIIVSYLDTLGGIYKKHRGAREVTMSALNTILGVEVLPTLNKAKADFKEVEKSVAVLSHRSQKMQTKVIKALEKSNELTKQYEKNVSDLRAFMASSRTGKVKKAMKNLDKILDGTHKIVKRVVAAEKQVPLIRRQLKDLGENPGGVDKANIIISQTINLCNALAGIADAAAVGKAIESVVLADLSAWNDAVDIGKEIADL